MKKFIVTGDLHYKGVNPRAWLADFPKAMLRELREVFGLAVKHQAEAIVIPGDIFDSPQTALGTLAEVAQLLQEAPCRVLVIAGNHDLWGHNITSKPRTPYGFLARLGLVWDLTDEAYEIRDRGTGALDVCVTGRSYSVETDTPAGAEQFCPPEHLECYSGTSIHVVHSMLMDHSPGFDMRHTLISEVKTTANVIISGHEHIGFGIYRRDDGVLFINPGALCRLSASAKEIERPVQVALLSVDGEGNAEAELIPLKCAAPGHEVLSREHLENEAERNARMDEFLSLLASEGESKFLEVQDIVEDIAARENVPVEVKADALKRIGEAREELAGKDVRQGVA